MNNKYLLYIIIALSTLVIINNPNTSIYLFIGIILIATAYAIYVAVITYKKMREYTSIFIVLGISGLMLITMRILDEFFIMGGLNEDYLIVRQFISIISLTLPAIILIRLFIKENFLVKK